MPGALDFDQIDQRRHAMRLRLFVHRGHPVPGAGKSMFTLQGTDHFTVAKDFSIGVQRAVEHGDRHAQVLLGVEREIGQPSRRLYAVGEFASGVRKGVPASRCNHRMFHTMGMRHQVAVRELRARRVPKQTKSRAIDTGEQACLTKAVMQEDIGPVTLTADTAVSIARRSTHAGREQRHAEPFASRNEFSDLWLPMATDAEDHHQQWTID